MIPDVIMNGLTVAGNMLPAVGMAMLLQMLWDNKIAIYFLLGFILVAYLYIQFEGYAFYALPLFIWGIYDMASLHSIVTSEQSCTR